MLTTTGFVNGKGQFSTPDLGQIWHQVRGQWCTLPSKISLSSAYTII